MSTAMPVGVIKKLYGDFQVLESGLPLCFETTIYPADGPYTSFALTKRGVENDPAMREVADQLQVPLYAVSSCGRKDSFAETVQEIVVAGRYRPTFTHNRIWIRQLGPARGPLHYGGHQGNTFSIKVYTNHLQRINDVSFKNYFGYQRFGGTNVAVGKCLLVDDFEGAYDALENTREQVYRDRRVRKKVDGRFLSKAEVMLHSDLRDVCKRSVQAWQSHLWNTLAELTHMSAPGERLPFWTLRTAHLYQRWFDASLVPRNNVMLSFAFPLERLLMATAEKLSADRERDGWRYCFTLGSGSYATTFLGSHYKLQDVSVDRIEAQKAVRRMTVE